MQSSDDFATELREINLGLDKDGRMLRSLYESMVSGLITGDEFTAMKAGYEAKIAKLSQKANEIRQRKYEAHAKAAEYRDLSEAVSTATNDDTLTGEIVGRLIREIQVSPDKSFVVKFRYRDEFGGVRYAG